MREAALGPQNQTGQTALDCARLYAGRDLAEALLAWAAATTADAGAAQPSVEWFTTPDGERAVRLRADFGHGSGWVRELCDGFHAIVQLLDSRPSSGEVN